MGASVGELEIVEGFGIRREVSHGCTVFWSHVGDGGSVGETEIGDTRTEEFYKFTNNSTFSESVSDLKDQISSSDVFPKRSLKSETDNFGKDHGNGLTEHDCLGFNTSHSPSNHTETIDHGGVRVSSDNRVRVDNALAVFEDDSGEVLEVDLMDDTAAWGNDAEVVEGSRAPFQEFKAFVVALELDLLVLSPGVLDSGLVNLHGVVDDEIDRAEGVDFLGIAAQTSYCVSHGSEIDDSGDSGEILEDDSRGFESDFNGFAGQFLPVEDVLHIFGGDLEFIAVSDCAFEEDANAEGEALESGVIEGLYVVVGESLSCCLDLACHPLEGVWLGVCERESAER